MSMNVLLAAACLQELMLGPAQAVEHQDRPLTTMPEGQQRIRPQRLLAGPAPVSAQA